jgi:hypothetical protein
VSRKGVLHRSPKVVCEGFPARISRKELPASGSCRGSLQRVPAMWIPQRLTARAFPQQCSAKWVSGTVFRGRDSSKGDSARVVSPGGFANGVPTKGIRLFSRKDVPQGRSRKIVPSKGFPEAGTRKGVPAMFYPERASRKRVNARGLLHWFCSRSCPELGSCKAFLRGWSCHRCLATLVPRGWCAERVPPRVVPQGRSRQGGSRGRFRKFGPVRGFQQGVNAWGFPLGC